MCVVFPVNPFPFLEWILFVSLVLLAMAISSLVWLVYNEFSERRARTKQSPRKSKPRWTLGNSSSDILVYPWLWMSTMVARPVAYFYHVFRRTLSSFTWWRSEGSLFDHKKLAHDSRWEKFWRERVLPADSEQLRSSIPLDLFPVIRQTQLGTVVAYSEQYVQELFVRSSQQTQTSSKEKYVLVLRGPRSENENGAEPRFKDVVTDMLQLKQVRGILLVISIFIQLFLTLTCLYHIVECLYITSTWTYRINLIEQIPRQYFLMRNGQMTCDKYYF